MTKRKKILFSKNNAVAYLCPPPSTDQTPLKCIGCHCAVPLFPSLLGTRSFL